MPIQIPEMTVKDEIGRGAGTIVYRALWRGRTVALKVPAQDYGREPEWDAWFRREGALLACIDHPGVAQVLEVGEVQGRPYLVREYVAGRTLAHHLQSGPLPAGQVKNLAVSLAGALGEVHRRGLVHRDIKPLNIILADTGEPMLIDFGLATRFQLDDASQAVGTLLYSSPEQSRMLKRPVDGRSDLYSLGVVLFECAVGSPPFGSDDVGELLRQHAVAPAPDPRSLNPGLEPELAAIISRLLAKDPDDRYQSAADLLGALGAPVQASLERPLVGRQAELQALLAGWQEAARGLRSVLAVGLEVGDELRGVVYLDSRLARGIFDDSDLQIVRALSNHIAVAIEHARATQVELRYQAERRQRDLAEGLRDLMRELASTLDSREVLERLLERLDDLLPSRSAAATLFATGQTVARGFAGEPSPPEQSKPEEGRLVCPLMQGEEQLGAVWLEDPGGFGPREVELLATFAGQAVVALRNAELFAEVRRRATTDELTGLANRPHFFELAEKQLQRARRSGAGLWVVMMDVDHFKRFNDTYGHVVGDHVLAHVADLCRQSLREVDLVGRYGGEEFAMVFPDTGVEARVVAERLRETIAGSPLLTEGQALTVTVSLGLSRWSPEEPALEAVLERADAALYRAKAEGRNRVVVG